MLLADLAVVRELRDGGGGGLGGERVARLQREERHAQRRLERRALLVQPARPRAQQRAPGERVRRLGLGLGGLD